MPGNLQITAMMFLAPRLTLLSPCFLGIDKATGLTLIPFLATLCQFFDHRLLRHFLSQLAGYPNFKHPMLTNRRLINIIQ